MLPSLINADVFQYVPDVDGLDLWASDFRGEVIPAKPGVYCFYDAGTQEILYVGSACARGAYKYGCGLFGRLQRHRQRRCDSLATKRIQSERKTRRIWVRFWVTASAGDAVKCEQDTIEKHKPVLNTTMAKPTQSVEERAMVLENKKREHRNRSPDDLPSEATPHTCSDCGATKPLSDFSKNIGRKTGHNSVCKKCMRVRWQVAHQK